MLRIATLVPVLALLAAAPLLAYSDSPAPLSRKAQEALAGRAAGTPVACIELSRIGSTRIVDETAIIYKQSPRRWYINQPDDGRCEHLKPKRTLITHTATGRLCGNDQVTIAEPSSQATYGACGLGKFVPYIKSDVPSFDTSHR